MSLRYKRDFSTSCKIILSTCPRQRTLHLLRLPPYKLASKTNRSKISHAQYNAQYNDLKYGKHWPMVVYRKQCRVHTMYRHHSIKYLFTTPDIYCLHNTKLRQYNGHVFTSNLLGRTMNGGLLCSLFMGIFASLYTPSSIVRDRIWTAANWVYILNRISTHAHLKRDEDLLP